MDALSTASTKVRVVAIGPQRGGVADAHRRAMLELQTRGHIVESLAVPTGRVPALGALAGAWRARKRLRAATILHLEFGSNDLSVFWFAVGCVLLRTDCVIVAHDYPKFAHVPTSALIPTRRPRLHTLSRLVLAPVLDARLVRLVLRRAGIIVAFNETAQSAWLAAGARRVAVVSHGGEAHRSGTLPPSQGDCVLFAGFLSPHKGLDTLMEAWRLVGSSVDLPLIIAGGPAHADVRWLRNLQETATTLPNSPQFTGEIPDDRDFQSLIDRAALVVLPYRFSSPASGILARAMCAGRPVIATPVPATSPAIIDGQNGVLVPIDSVDALSEAILRLASTPGERDRLGDEAARGAGEIFSWPRLADQLEQAYGDARQSA